MVAKKKAAAKPVAAKKKVVIAKEASKSVSKAKKPSVLPEAIVTRKLTGEGWKRKMMKELGKGRPKKM